MSLFEKRLQILLDQDRHDRLTREAERSGRSVGAIIREAIDVRFPDDEDARRAAAAQRLLAWSDTSEDAAGDAESVQDFKRGLDDELTQILPQT